MWRLQDFSWCHRFFILFTEKDGFYFIFLIFLPYYQKRIMPYGLFSFCPPYGFYTGRKWYLLVGKLCGLQES